MNEKMSGLHWSVAKSRRICYNKTNIVKEVH